MSKGYIINQRGWFVARENFKTHKLEYLHHKTDHWYLEGCQGYGCKAEALERADRYQGEDCYMFIIGPSYGRYRISSKRESQRSVQPLNTRLARLMLMDRVATEDDVPELKRLLREFVMSHGVWCFSSQRKAREFIMMIGKYDVLTDAELARLMYERD